MQELGNYFLSTRIIYVQLHNSNSINYNKRIFHNALKFVGTGTYFLYILDV